MKKSVKRFSVILAAVLLIGMLAMSVCAVGAAVAEEPTEITLSTVAITDATSATMPVSSADSASGDSATPDIPNTGNGSIPTGDNSVAVWAFAAITFIVAATGVACVARRHKESK